MDRRTIESTGTALLGILALGLAAATLSPSISNSGGGGSGSGGGGGIDVGGPSGGPSGSASWALPESVQIVLGLVLAAVVLYGLYFLLRNHPRMVLGFATLAGLYVLAGLLFPDLVSLSPGELPFGEGGAGDGSGSGSGPPSSDAPVTPVLAVLAVAVVGAFVVALQRRRSGSTAPDDGDASDDGTADPETVARAAGAAADRIEEGGDVGNEVFRAWREMTDMLDVRSAGAKTPGEFAEAAVEAGMARDDVRELTRLFEDVRYGGDEPTPDSERRARDVFRSIESAYGAET